MKIMIVGDVHWADRAPSSCTDSYTEDLFELVEECRRLAAKLGCVAVVQAGDLVHVKTPGRTSHRLIQRIIEQLKSFPCPVYVVPGNHDLSNDRFESLFEGQPLGVIYRSGAANLLSGWADSTTWMGKPFAVPGMEQADLSLPLYGVPWLQGWNSEDSVADAQVEAATEQLRDRSDGSAPVLLVTHAPFYPPGSELTYEHYLTERFAAYLPERTSVYYGHVHDEHGVYTSGGRTFANAGALSRGSIAEGNLTREVSVTVWDSVTGAFEIVPIPHKPASEVFRLTEVRETRDVQKRLDTFLAGFGAASIQITSIEDVLHHVRGLDLPTEVVTVVVQLLEDVSGT